MEALPALWIVVLTFLLAGTVKGTAGVGLPMTALGVLTFFTDPRTAIAVALVPIVLSNAMQLYRAGDVAGAVRRYWIFLLCLLVGIPVTLALTAEVSDALLLVFLGGVILTFVALNLTRWAPSIPDGLDRPAQFVLGATAGFLGGLTSIWLPPMVIYLASRGTTKEEFIRATALLLLSGSLPLTAGYFREGFLTGQLALVSLALVIPTGAGLLLGERLRHRLSETGFRKLLLVIFALIGLNMIRRAVLG